MKTDWLRFYWLYFIYKCIYIYIYVYIYICLRSQLILIWEVIKYINVYINVYVWYLRKIISANQPLSFNSKWQPKDAYSIKNFTTKCSIFELFFAIKYGAITLANHHCSGKWQSIEQPKKVLIRFIYGDNCTREWCVFELWQIQTLRGIVYPLIIEGDVPGLIWCLSTKKVGHCLIGFSLHLTTIDLQKSTQRLIMANVSNTTNNACL